MCRIVRRGRHLVCTECVSVISRKFVDVEEELEELVEVYGVQGVEEKVEEMGEQ